MSAGKFIKFALAYAYEDYVRSFAHIWKMGWMALGRHFKESRGWTLLPRTRAGIQRKLDVFRCWYNSERPMFVLNGRTPEEVWAGAKPPRGRPILAH